MKIKIIFLCVTTYVFSQELLNETFDNVSSFPYNGWEFIPDPSQYPPNTGEWRISTWSTSFNTTPPAPTYYWGPAQSGTNDNPYSGHYMYSPIINVGDTTNVIVRFQIALDGFPSDVHYNGMNIEYNSDGTNWIRVLNYEISSGSGDQVDIFPRTESFYATMGQTLQIRWETYGSNSYYIDNWHVDNVRVDVVQSIAEASIFSSNEDPQKAIPGDTISLAFQLPNNPDPGSPFVLINSSEVELSNILNDYTATYIVPDDATDGPISFVIDFTSDGISGPTCRKTTDNSNVLIDVTGPVSPVITDNVLSLGTDGAVGIWSSSDDQVQVDVMVPSDTTVIAFEYETGNSISFNGTTGYASIPMRNEYRVDYNFTFEAYINVRSSENFEGFLDFGNYDEGTNQSGFGAFLYSGGWRFYLRTEQSAFGDIQHVVASAPVDTWAHFAVTFGNGTLKLYRDGILVDSRGGYSGPVDWSGFSGDLTLGRFDYDEGQYRYFDGLMDEVRFWNVTKSENQIKAYKTIDLTGQEAGLVGYWKFDESTGLVSSDLTTTNNSANIINASFVQDSEFRFQEEVLNTNAIIGSKFQILSKILGNDSFTPIGDRIEIVEIPPGPGILPLTALGDSFETIPEFAHSATAEFSARLFDEAGNFADGNTSTTTLEIDIETEAPTLVSFESDNTFSHLAKTGDTITISLTYPEDVNLPEITIDGNSSSESVLSARQFQSKYTFNGTEPEGLINTLQSSATDYLGNSGVYNGGLVGSGASAVRYDRTKPELDDVSIFSSNNNTKWAMVGDTVMISITGSEAILDKEAAIQGQQAEMIVIDSSIFSTRHKFSDSDNEGLVNFNISFSDSAGNDGINVVNTTDQSWVVFDKTPPEDFSTGTVSASGGNQIIDTWNSTNTSVDISIPIAENDTTLIKGKIQILAKVASNDWEIVGGLFEIDQSDVGSDKVVTITGSDIESITGFAEEDTIKFKAILFDRPGNQKYGDASTSQLVIDQIPPTISLIHIHSSNDDSTKAKVGDQIKISFTADELISAPVVNISNNEATLSNPESFIWEAIYVMSSDDSEGIIPFEIEDFIDTRGNPAAGANSTYDGSSVLFDKTKPELIQVELVTNNDWNENWAKSGEKGLINISSSEDLLTLDLTINSNNVAENWVDPRTINHEYIFSDLDEEGVVVFELVFSDSAGNNGDIVVSTTNDSYIIFDKTAPEDFTLGTVSSKGGNEVALFWNSTNTELSVTVPIDNDTTLNNGRVQILVKIGEREFEELGEQFIIEPDEVGLSKIISFEENTIRSITGFDQGAIITTSAIVFDIPGNQKNGLESENLITIEEVSPDITHVSYKSDFSDTTLATVGNQITVTIKTDEAIQEPSVMIFGNNTNINFEGGNKWSSTYTLQEQEPEGVVFFQINEILDLAGNPKEGTSMTTDGSVVVFDNTRPTLDLVRIISNNSDSTWAKVGDSILVTFIGSELLTQQSVTVSNQTADVSDLGSEKYVAVYEMKNEDPEGQVNFQIIVTDSVGLESQVVSETSNSSTVIFDKPLPLLNEVSISSTNSNNSSIAVTGDDVILLFTSTEPLLFESLIVTIAGETAVLTQEGDIFKGTLNLSGNEPGGILSYTIDFKDRASNSGIQVVSTTDDSYVNHDIVPPELLAVTIYSSNDDTTWAKEGDTVYVKFNANEPLDNLDIIISGTSSDHTDDGAAFYTGFRVLNENDDEGPISFNIEYTDLGGATGPSANSSTDQSYVKYDRTFPFLTNIRMKSTNSMIDSAGIGDLDSLFFTASEPQRNLEVQILSSSVEYEQDGLQFYSIYELAEDDPDGYITFSITLIDSAGNSTGQVIGTDDGSSVWYDGTVPTMSPVSFHSTNVNNDGVAVLGDTLILDFTSSESLSNISVSIAGIVSEINLLDGILSTYQSKRILDGSEDEGAIPFRIIFSDLVGNDGDAIISTTDGTSILFDMTPPAQFTLDSSYSSGGNIIPGYWNSSSDSIFLSVSLPLDDQSLVGGRLQPRVNFGNTDYVDLGDPIEITNIPIDGPLTVGIDENTFESIQEYSENIDVTFTMSISDRAGNVTIGNSDNRIIHIDEVLPVLTNLSISSNNVFGNKWATKSDVITISFRSSEGLNSPIFIISSDSVVQTFSEDGAEWSGIYTVKEQDSDGLVDYSVTFADSAGNIGSQVTETTDGTKIIIDNTPPEIKNLREGANELDIPYYNIADSITLYWEHEDTTSGIRESYYGLGSDSNNANINDWASVADDNYGGWNNLSLSNNSKYFGGAFTRDSVGNYSDTIWGDGITIDTEIPDTGSIIDGYWLIDLDQTPDSTRLSYRWSEFSDNVGIDYYQLAIGTYEDSTDILSWTRTDSTDSLTIQGLSLQKNILYNTYIKAVDLASNKSHVQKTDGIYFDNSVPTINAINPDFFADTSDFLSVLYTDTIKIKFNRPLYSYRIEAKSRLQDDLFYDHSYDDSLITIILSNVLTSLDTVLVVLDSAIAYNTLQMNDTIRFYSQLWGDLNYDYDLTVEDILIFNKKWPLVDLGPFENEPPYVRPTPDGNSDLTDLSAFAKMWQWRYFNLSFDTTRSLIRSESSLDITGKGSCLLIPTPKLSSMGELLIGDTDIDLKESYVSNFSNEGFIFKAYDPSNEIVQFSFANDNGIDSAIAIYLPKNASDQFSGTIQYHFFDSYGKVLLEGVSHLNINFLPEKFQVYKNYPNPFNPVTFIEYDLPNTRNVGITVIDIVGRTVKHNVFKNLKPGRHTYTWNGIGDLGHEASAGVYFLYIQAGQEVSVQKMLLLK